MWNIKSRCLYIDWQKQIKIKEIDTPYWIFFE